MRKERKHYSGEEKVAILRRHLLDKVPISDLCDELGLQPTVFYRWQKEFFENGAAAFQGKGRPDHPAERLNEMARQIGYENFGPNFRPQRMPGLSCFAPCILERVFSSTNDLVLVPAIATCLSDER
jgi:transposase